MNKALKILGLLCLLLAQLHLFAQQGEVTQIPEVGLSFVLPNTEWTKVSRQVLKSKNVVYRYERTLPASSTKKIKPSITIIAEPRPAEQTITAYSPARMTQVKKQKNFREEKVFTNTDGMLKLSYAVGIKCYYDDAAGVNRTIYIIHALHLGKGIQVWLEVATEDFKFCEEELTGVIRSLEYLR